jgi:hypothetical protein
MLKRLHAWRVCPRDLQVGDEMTSRRRNSASFRRSQLRRQGGKAESYVFVKIAAGRDSAVAGGKSLGRRRRICVVAVLAHPGTAPRESLLAETTK